MVRSNTAEAGKIAIAALILFVLIARASQAADPMVGIHSARVMSQSMPWMAQEAGLFKKYNLDFNLVFISSSSIVTAALLGGDAEMTITGGDRQRGGLRARLDRRGIYRRRQKHHDPDPGRRRQYQETGRSQRQKDRRQPNRRQLALFHHTGAAPFGYGARVRDVQFIQTGGDPETLAAFISGAIDVANLTPPTDAQAIAKGYHYVIYGPDLKIPYAATAFVTKRSVIAKRPQVIGKFMRAMAETAEAHAHRSRIRLQGAWANICASTDRKVLDSAYNAEIKVLEPRLVIKTGCAASDSR